MSTRRILAILMSVFGVAAPTVGLVLLYGIKEPVALRGGEDAVGHLLVLLGGMAMGFLCGLLATRISRGKPTKVIQIAIQRSRPKRAVASRAA